MNNMPSLLEPRLQLRYQQLVAEHLTPTQQIAAGLRSLPGIASSFASTQAAWRFYGNLEVTLPRLAEPLLSHAREAVGRECEHFALVVHDWSLLSFNSHTRKRDRVSLQKHDLGYELHTALVVSDRGDPLAPVYLGLRAGDGLHHTGSAQVETPASKLDGLRPLMDRIEALQWGKPIVHIIDAEADSVGHYRDWHRSGHRFLVRADRNRVVKHEGRDRSLDKIAACLRRQRQFQATRKVTYHGHEAQQFVAETTVCLTRPARPQRCDGQPRREIPGPALSLRLVVVEVRSERGRLLARWLLLTNVVEVAASELALWYYWRWQVELYFKLLKGGGWHLEQWQQESAGALARRLTITAMASVVVWQLERCTDPAGIVLRDFVVDLSGRQTKRRVPVTAPALLEGLGVLLRTLEILDHFNVSEIRNLLDQAGLGFLSRRPTRKVV